MSISKLDLNLLVEQVYLEGHVHAMYTQILKEEKPNKINPHLERIKTDLKLAANIMLTFGVGISGFFGPVNELLRNQGIKITEYDLALLIVGSTYVLLVKSKEDTDKLVAEIKKRGLLATFKKVINFMSKMTNFFTVVGKKIGIVAHSLTDLLAFTFMTVPILNIIRDLIMEKGFTLDNVGQLLAGLALSAGTYFIKNLLQKHH